MALIPTPRSYSQILGDMIDAFLSRFGLRALKIGSPVLSMLESAAQSQLRSSEDIFELLEASSLDQATGDALDRIGADEDLPRFTQNPASGPVTISDTSFSKISSKVFQGTAAPIVGSTKVNVTDGSQFPASGSVYIGRGTSNYEGPLAYTSKVNAGNYWTLNLAASTLRFHNLGESVIVAQGGNRTINAGTIVQTPQGAVLNAIQFKLLFAATLPDGEVTIEGVTVVALKPGATGNVIAGGISSFTAPPFAGADVNNPVPYTNGLATEQDDTYRERIRAARASRARGTALAIQTFATGVVAPDENKRVLSASVVSRQGIPTTLYIDDGTGYEEVSIGVAIESMVDSALGGEDFFRIGATPPVTKAYVLTFDSAPFTLASGLQLAFSVGGVTTVHTFSADEFRSIGNATAFEVVASINANASLNWAARPVASGTKVAVFAKADIRESIQNVAAQIAGDDANALLGFPVTRVDSMRLYKNDRLLNKDGLIATLSSQPVALWGGFTSPEDLQLQVDGTPMANLAGGTFTFTNQDFIDANTGFATLGRNTPAAWAKVFNRRIPGVTATVVNGVVVLTSNLGTSGRASLAVLGGSLVTKGMFALTAVPVVGADSDYTLDRNTGELRLANPLAAGDALAAGTVSTRAFLESPPWSTITEASDGHFWFAVDGNAVIVPQGVTTSTNLTFSTTVEPWGVRVHCTSGTAGTFTQVNVGDWVIFWDPGIDPSLLDKAFRIAATDNNFEFDFDASAFVGFGPVTLANAGITIVRTLALLQEATVPAAANYTAAGLAPVLNAALVGAQATVYKTTALRINTSTFSAANGDIALAAADPEAQRFGLPVGNATKNLVGHLASIEAANSEVGTPDFHETIIVSSSGPGDPNVDWLSNTLEAAPDVGDLFVGLRPQVDATTLAGTRYGNNLRFSSPLVSSTLIAPPGYALVPRVNPPEYLLDDRAYFAAPYQIASDDDFAVLVDGDLDTKRFIVPMWRTLKTVGGVYAATNTFKDADNSNQSLSVGFGYTGADPFDFNDFAIYMAARAKTNDQGTFSSEFGAPLPDLNKTVLWRYYRLGEDGELARVRYTLPSAPNLPVAVVVDSFSDQHTNVSIQLASGALRTGYVLPDSYPIATVAPTFGSGLTDVYYLLGYHVRAYQRRANIDYFQIVLQPGMTHTGLDLTGATGYDYVDAGGGTPPTQNITATAEGQSNTPFPAAGWTFNAGPGVFDVVSRPFGGADIPEVLAPGTLYFQAAPPLVTLPTLAGGGVAQGDFLYVDPTAGLPTDYKGTPLRIENNVVADPLTIHAVYDNFLGAISGTPTFHALGNAALFQIYANPKQSTATVVGAVNTLIAGAGGAAIPVRPTLIGNGSRLLDRSSAEDLGLGSFNNPSAYAQLADGLNYVGIVTVPAILAADYQFQFKKPITAALATNSDWASEVVKISPRTAKNVVDWLNRPAVSGLFSATDIERSSNAHKVQIASLTPGSGGLVEVQGGTANNATAAVVGSGALAGSTYLVTTVDAGELSGLLGWAWASIDNTTRMPKNVVNPSNNTGFGTVVGIGAATTVLASIVNTGPDSLLTFTTGKTFVARTTWSASVIAAVERQGRFLVVRDTGFGGALAINNAREGDWVRLWAPDANIYVGAGGFEAVAQISAGNLGIFRLVRIVSESFGLGSGAQFWFEDPSGVEQALTEVNIQFLTYDSLLPGDTVHISTALWDGSTSNQGIWTVVDVGNATGAAGDSFLVDTKLTLVGPLSVVGAPAAVLGAEAPRIQVVEGTNGRLIKRIIGIAPNQTDFALADVKFATGEGYAHVSAAAGSIISILDKLEFPLSIAGGVDGYQHSVGLIGEVQRVIYGDPTDPATYPGVAAAGASINIQGPLVKRIQVTLSIRVRSGAALQDIEDRVKSAVAAVINQAGVGESIALSDLVNAARKVGGVVSVVMVNPLATVGSDLISVQPYEKPLVLDVDQDILVSFVGI